MSVSDSELLVLKCIWDAGRALSVAEIIELLKTKYGKTYKHSTVCTFLSRLKEKNYVGYTVHGKLYLYFPLISQAVYLKEEMDFFRTFWFDDSFTAMVKAFAAQHTFTEKEIKKLRTLSETVKKSTRV